MTIAFTPHEARAEFASIALKRRWSPNPMATSAIGWPRPSLRPCGRGSAMPYRVRYSSSSCALIDDAFCGLNRTDLVVDRRRMVGSI